MKIKNEILNCLLIYNDINIDQGIPVDLGEWTVEKPELKDIPLISDHFKSIIGNFKYAPYQETKIVKNSEWNYGASHLEDKSEYRYLIIKPKKTSNNNNIKKVKEALRLSRFDIWAESTLHNEKYGKSISFNPNQVGVFFNFENSMKEPTIVDWSEILDIVKLREDFNEKEYPQIVESIKMFKDNDSISDKSHLKHLGYFAIIESLLTHNPALNDSIDSITRQLKRNLILLNNRKEGETDLMLDGFNEISPDKIISKLYSYRSQIAHGGNGIQELKELSKFKLKDTKYENWNKRDQIWISFYLRSIVKGVLIHSLREPRLFTDLK